MWFTSITKRPGGFLARYFWHAHYQHAYAGLTEPPLVDEMGFTFTKRGAQRQVGRVMADWNRHGR